MVKDIKLQRSPLQNSNVTVTHCQENPTDCVMVKLELCNGKKVIYAVLYLKPLTHAIPGRVILLAAANTSKTSQQRLETSSYIYVQ